MIAKLKFTLSTQQILRCTTNDNDCYVQQSSNGVVHGVTCSVHHHAKPGQDVAQSLQSLCSLPPFSHHSYQHTQTHCTTRKLSAQCRHTMWPSS